MSGKDLEAFDKAHNPEHVREPERVFKRHVPRGTKKFIVVGAQNATPIHEDWFAVLKCIAEAQKAFLMVVPLRYKNPTSLWTASQRNDEFWAPQVQPYLWSARTNLAKNLTVVADLKIPPTKSSPLSGFEAMSTHSSAIFAHPKLEMKTVPVPSGRMAKVLTTTGACTQANYTDTGLGKIGEFHHSYSAVLVEVENAKRFHIRHLHYHSDSKSCTDLNRTYSADGWTDAAPAAGLVMGDLHVGFIDPKVEKARAALVALTKPHTLVWNDTLDSYSCTPHHEGNPFINQTKAKAGRGDVRAEVNRAIDYLLRHTGPGVISVVVPSNHDDMLARWIKRTDWRSLSAENADFYLEVSRAMLSESKMTASGVSYPDPFTLLVQQRHCKQVVALNRDDSYRVAGIEVGMHGDIGPNGVRGSRKNLRRVGVKSVIGHSHAPGIDEGCYQVGTSTRLRLEYNHGPSGWLNADCLILANGKRQIIIYIDGKYRI